MELNKHICTQMEETGRAFAQITLDDDYIVRDNKPDALRIIYTKGDVLLEDVKVGNQVVWVTGRLRFSTLYQTDDDNRRLESITGEIPFQEKLIMDDVDEDEDLSVNIQIEDLSSGIINSRKLGVRAVLNILAVAHEEEQEEIVCVMDRDSDWEQKVESVPIMCLVDNRKDVIRMQKELLLPNSRSNIGELIFYQVDFRNEEVILRDDCVHVEMDAFVWVLYRGEGTGEYECFEATVPLAGEMDCGMLLGDEIFWARMMPVEIEVEPRGDYDGENRMLGLDVALSVEVQIYREEECQMLQDAYALDRELILERENIPIQQLLVKNISKIRLMEQHHLEPNQERILQICGSSGTITIDRVEKRPNGIQVEGVLNVHILYNTTEDAMPYAHTSAHLPFEQFVEIEGFSEDAVVWLDGRMEQLQVNLLDNTEYEVKAVIQIGLLAFRKDFISSVVDIEEEELDMEALQKQPGMIGCVRREGEDIWDIAKKYHASSENIMEIGNKVLIVKQVR